MRRLGTFGRGSGLVWLALLVSPTAGCGQDEAADDNRTGEMRTNIAPPRAGDGLVGRWQGRTSQDLSLAFRVEDTGLAQAVSALEFGLRLGSCTWDSTVTFAEPAPIIENRFVVKVQTERGSTDIDIEFGANDLAEGKLSFAVAPQAAAEECTGDGEATFTAGRE